VKFLEDVCVRSNYGLRTHNTVYYSDDVYVSTYHAAPTTDSDIARPIPVLAHW